MTTLTTAQKIEALKAHALAHYDKGGDVPTECWEDAEWTELLNDDGGDLVKATAFLDQLMSVWHDRQMDAINSAF